ncbi:MAG TPA: hypothetical protein VFK47_21735, partial [Ktedonobacteraceae bacterium]|nr:hypothetical protein [Ktedonobacteraceae bacterium]
KTIGQRGGMNILLLPVILLTVFFLTAVGFGLWAFTSRQDFKDNSDKKVAAAVAKAQSDTQAADAAQYAEQSKQPLDTYIGPSAFGNITVKYPKTWSAYVIENDKAASPVNAYFHPNFVPDPTNRTNAFALRVQLVTQSYDSVINGYTSQVQSKQVTIAPYKLAKVPSVVGSRIEGQIQPTKQGTMIVLPLRNMTLEIWTESNSFVADLDNNILPNLSFQP